MSDGADDGGTQTGRTGAASVAVLAPLIRAVERCAELLEAGTVIQMDGETVAGKIMRPLSRKMGVLSRR
jgi:hypothetical protein